MPENACCVQQHFKIYCVKSKTLFRRFVFFFIFHTAPYSFSPQDYSCSCYVSLFFLWLIVLLLIFYFYQGTTNNCWYKLGDLLFFDGRINATRKIAIRAAEIFFFLALRKKKQQEKEKKGDCASHLFAATATTATNVLKYDRKECIVNM